MRVAVALASLLLLHGCSASETPESYGDETTDTTTDASWTSAPLVSANSATEPVPDHWYTSSSGYVAGRLNEDTARENAAADVPMTYEEAGQPYGCTEDCGGHGAGYQWAIDNVVTSPDDCGGNSYSFEEGCRSYGEEIDARVEEMRDEGLIEE